jgi:putative addiction module component (TIGR02574 family)
MNKIALSELFKLPPAERIQLAQDLWDSIPEQDVPDLTPEQIVELETRLSDHERDPSSGVSWAEVRERLRARYRQSEHRST